jgi:uncharacterized ion transporter superfamily protein YfcC
MFTILFVLIALAIAATWVTPGGRFAAVSYDSGRNVLVVADGDQERTLPPVQQSLTAMGVHTPVNVLTSGTATRPISIPGTYRRVPAAPQGPLALVMSPIRGAIEAVDVIIFILVIGGFIALYNRSGAFDSGIAALATKLEGREHWLVIVFTVLFAIGGTTEGTAEETIAFYPLLAPVFMRAGYDRIVPLAVILGGSQMGCLGGTMNPFSIILASATIGVRWTDELTLRACVWVLVVTITIVWTLRYAARARSGRTAWLAPFDDAAGNAVPAFAETAQGLGTAPEMSGKNKLLLIMFGLTFVAMIVGVSMLDWWFPEMSALFLGSAILAAFIQGGDGKAETFRKGVGDFIGVASLVALARAISITLQAGNIEATMVQSITETLAGTSGSVFLAGAYLFYVLIGMINASSTAVAVLTMPLLGPAATAVGVSGASVVSAYVFGQNTVAIVSPANVVIPSLAIMGVPYGAWLRFAVPLLVMAGLVSLAALLAWG